jgi:glucan phosphoethanolaminetransferase (alkaline phosphatase superfamily)
MWSCPWSIGITLFYLSRYLLFIDQPLFLYVQLVGGSPNTCSALLSLALVGMSTGFLSSQVIITLRTCAMWGRQRWVLAVLGMLTLVSCVFSVYTFISEVISTIAANRVSTPPGCKAHPLGKSYLGWFYLIMATECTIVILTIIKAYQHLRHSTSDWISQLYKNGIFYSICVLLLGAINVLFIAIDVVRPHSHSQLDSCIPLNCLIKATGI